MIDSPLSLSRGKATRYRLCLRSYQIWDRTWAMDSLYLRTRTTIPAVSSKMTDNSPYILAFHIVSMLGYGQTTVWHSAEHWGVLAMDIGLGSLLLHPEHCNNVRANSNIHDTSFCIVLTHKNFNVCIDHSCSVGEIPRQWRYQFRKQHQDLTLQPWVGRCLQYAHIQRRSYKRQTWQFEELTSPFESIDNSEVIELWLHFPS